MSLAWFSNKSAEGNIFDDPPKPPSPEPYRGAPRSLTSDFATPHDDVLAGIHAQVGDTSPRSDAALLPTIDVLHDPYDGSAVGEVMLSNPALHPDVNINQATPSKREEEIWEQLSRVLDVQSQIASRHLQMEGIGTRSADGKGKGKGKGAQSQVSLWEDVGSKEGLSGQKSHRGNEDEDVELSAEAEEEKRNREREEEFAKLARQFEGRKEGITAIMDELDELSRALTKFHYLQAPRIDFGFEASSGSTGDNISNSISTVVPPTDTTSH